MKSTPTRTQARRSKQTETFNWQICEDDNAWSASHQDTQMAPSIIKGLQPLHSWRRWSLVLVAMTLLFLAAGVNWMQAQQESATITSEVRSAVEIEARMIDAGATDPPPASHSISPAGVQGAEIVDRGNGWARVRVTVQEEDGTNYRQTRIYEQSSREQGAEWVRSVPTGSRWGQPRQWESTYFRFHYYAQDEEAVKAAAPKLDALFPTFYAAFFAGDPPSQKVTVVVDPAAAIMTRNGATSRQDAPLTLPSPSATLAPLEVSEEALLVQGVALALFNRLAVQSDAFSRSPTGAIYLLSGLRLWLLWDQELPLARWREPLVRWVFSADERVPVNEKNGRVPAFAHDFCAHHRLWLTSEMELGVPITCVHAMENEVFIAHRYSPPPIRMPYFVDGETLLADQYDNHLTSPTLPYASAVVFATLFEYVSAGDESWRIGAELKEAGSEGADRVRVLIDSLPDHQYWITLIPALIGVSKEEFEAGLNNFIVERYGVAP